MIQSKKALVYNQEGLVDMEFVKSDEFVVEDTYGFKENEE